MDFRDTLPCNTTAAPFTLLDDHSRFNRRCGPVPTRGKHGDRLTHVFRRYGLPQAMLMDNGWGIIPLLPSPSGSCNWASACTTADRTIPKHSASWNASTARSRALQAPSPTSPTANVPSTPGVTSTTCAHTMPWTSTPRSADTRPVVDLSPRPWTTPPTTTCVLWMSPVAYADRVWEKPSRISGSRSDGRMGRLLLRQRDLNEQNV